MGRRKCGRGRSGLGVLGALMLAQLAFEAHAALPPTVTGTPANFQIPEAGAPTITVNLRELGVIAGSAPLRLNYDDIEILIDGRAGSEVGLVARPTNTNGPGFVCVVIENGNFVPDGNETLQMRLSVSSLSTPRPTAPAFIGITNQPGPIVDTPAELAACDDPNTTPVANAGVDRTVIDNEGDGEVVVLDASGSSDADPGTVLTYNWFSGDTEFPPTTSPTFTTPALPPGTHTFSLTVIDDSGDPATNTSDASFVVVTVVANAPPTVDAGEYDPIPDSDGAPGELVTLSGTATDSDGTIVSYRWFANDVLIGEGATIEARLPDGITEVLLVVEDDRGATADDLATITIAAPNAPTANAGADRTVPDTDGQPGEEVTLDGSASVATGGIASYVWQNAAGEQLATGATPIVRLPDGANVLTLVITSNAGVTATDTVTITVGAAAQAPIASAGMDVSVSDTDREPGEIVTLDASGSSDPNGQPLTYSWSLQADPVVELGTGVTLTVRLPDGVNTVMLRVEDPDGNVATDTVVITIAAPAERISLAELPNLSPNQRSMALALDRICNELDQLSASEAALTSDQRALLERCNGLYFDNTEANQVQALEELGADDFAAARTQTLLFSNMLYASVMDRLVALRGGARGLSLAGLNIMVDGKLVPLAQLQQMVKGLLGGGASSDADEAGGLFGDKWGLWGRGNFSVGEKKTSAASPSFDADQWALMAGIDYRVTDTAVIGASFAYGQSGIDFNPSGEGSLETTSWASSIYGSMYAAKNFYFDAIVNVASSDYDAHRNITYVDGSGLVSANASGTTDGITLSAGISTGYDFLLGGLTLSPTLGVFYIDATIDGFTERGAVGLNLIYDEQQFSSLTGNLGLRATYAWNTSWGVLLPHVRIDYVREFEDDVDVFGVRFAADPNANSTPPILVQTDNPDRSYWRLATGFSAQFAHGISGYVEYQRLESFEYISFQDVSIGLRLQRAF